MALGSILELAGNAIKSLIDIFTEIAKDLGTDVTELRKKPMTVSVSFGGDEGEAVVYQRTVEALWTEEDEKEAGY